MISRILRSAVYDARYWPGLVFFGATGALSFGLHLVARRIDKKLCQIPNDSHLPLPHEDTQEGLR